MSNKTIGLVPHGMSRFHEVEHFASRLDSCTEHALRVWEAYGGKVVPEEPRNWRIRPRGVPTTLLPIQSPWGPGEGIQVDGPFGTWIDIGRHCVLVQTSAKWHRTIRQQPLLEAVWALTLQVGSLVRAPAALVYHEEIDRLRDAVVDGLSFSAIELALHDNGVRRVDELLELLVPEELITDPKVYFAQAIAN